MKKFITLPLSYEQISFADDRFVKVRIKVQHNGLNLNNSNFDDESISKAAPTLSNIPLLAFVKKTDGEDSADLGGHEVEFRADDNGSKFVYLGRPIGIVPETNNYSYEEDPNGKKFVIADGYIWKDYANEALEIIQRDGGKNVSMEIRVNSYSEADSYINITDFKYTGIAFLGEGVSPAMVGARADLADFSFQGVGEFVANFTAELKKAMEIEQPAAEPIVEPVVEPETEPIVEPIVEPEVEPIVEPEAEPIIEEPPVVEEPIVEEPAEEPKRDLEKELQEVKEEIEALKVDIEAAKMSLTSVTTERDELLAFKQGIEKAQFAANLENLLSTFSDLEEEEINEVITNNVSLNDIELRLFALRGKKTTPAPAKHIQTYAVYDGLISKPITVQPSWVELVEQYHPKTSEGGN